MSLSEIAILLGILSIFSSTLLTDNLSNIVLQVILRIILTVEAT